jgi:hypothetical protein
MKTPLFEAISIPEYGISSKSFREATRLPGLTSGKTTPEVRIFALTLCEKLNLRSHSTTSTLRTSPEPRESVSQEKQEWERTTVSAFTLAELWELLPDFIEVDHTRWTLTIERDFTGACEVRYGNAVSASGEAETVTDVCAKLLIYLLEHNVLPSEKRFG